MEDLIFRYLDGECTVSEIKEVEELLSIDPDFATLFTELEEANNLFMNTPLDPLPKGFANRVMQQITPQKVPQFNDLLLPKILLGILFVSVFAYVLKSINGQYKGFNFEFLDNIQPTIFTYSILLTFMFLSIDWYLNRKIQKQ